MTWHCVGCTLRLVNVGEAGRRWRVRATLTGDFTRLPERVLEESVAEELEAQGRSVERQVRVPGGRADLVIDSAEVWELKRDLTGGRAYAAAAAQALYYAACLDLEPYVCAPETTWMLSEEAERFVRRIGVPLIVADGAPGEVDVWDLEW